MHLYFLAIGGAGIGPLAEIAHKAGYEVSGSDLQNSSYIDYLKSHGISDIDISNSENVVKDAHEKNPIDWVVYSSAVPMGEIGQRQLAVVKSLGIKNTKRDEFISDFIKQKNLKMIAIAGTHGKTTTTAMLSWLFISLNIPVSYLIPAKVSFGEMGNYSEDSDYFIYEADEFDRNFLAFSPHLSLISGVSWDHHEVYPTREEYIQAFRDFINQSSKAVLWSSDAKYLGVSGDKILTQNDDQDLSAIKLTGEYNRRDGWLAAVSAADLTGASLDELINKLNSFPGLSRRMEEIYPNLFTDYAHTPDKIKGAISAASEIAKSRDKKLVVVYEPLTNRRQLHMLDDYKDCFNGADQLYWLPSYLAREDPKDRIVEPKDLIARLSNPSIAEPSEISEALFHTIKDHLERGDMVVAMAGGGGGSLDDWLRDNFTPIES